MEHEEKHEEYKKHDLEKKSKKTNLTEKARENPWIVSTVVLGILILVLLIGNFTGVLNGNVISKEEAGNVLLEFYESNGAEGLTLNSVEEVSGLYKVNFNYQGVVVPVYLTKDGTLAGSLNNIEPVSSTVAPTQENLPKSDKPVVELFVMSYCPYGTQAEKGILPVLALLGDKIDFKLRMVHYILHGEPEDLENKRQLCIREEEGNDKLNKYLVCMLDSDDPYAPADVGACEKKVGIDSTKLSNCLENNADTYFASDSEISKNYGVRGSPTLIINGVESSAGRSPASYLVGICSAFNSAPEECYEELSTTPPSAGFGYAEGTDTVAQC
ncbi:MAG: GILT family protein [Nanoarchaeota archaeon]|nr:GILT family protein [Nanoarchaeota archaeon]